MKLTKTNQKIDNNICKALTIACENSLLKVSGFVWLTHRVNYTHFPESLVVTCVFDKELSIEVIKKQQDDSALYNAIHKELLKVGVVLKNIKQQVHFDSEEACLREHQGDWAQRLELNKLKLKPNASRKTH